MASIHTQYVKLLKDSVENLNDCCDLLCLNDCSLNANNVKKAIEQVHCLQEKIISGDLIKLTESNKIYDVSKKFHKLREKLKHAKSNETDADNVRNDSIGLKKSHDQNLTNQSEDDSDVTVDLEEEEVDLDTDNKCVDGKEQFDLNDNSRSLDNGCSKNNVVCSKTDDIDSDNTDDLENFDDLDLDFDDKKKIDTLNSYKVTGVVQKPKVNDVIDLDQLPCDNNNLDQTADMFSDDDNFDDDDFDDDALMELEAAEKSYIDNNDSMSSNVEIPEINDDEENQPQDKKYLQILKQYFGYSKFRPMQWKILSSIMMEKRDNCVIMATGYGKSLCYQFPSLVSERTTVVISPLISLMQDQVLGLQAANIPSCYLGSAQENSGQVTCKLLNGDYRVLYITPEYATVGTDVLGRLNKSVGIDLIAIDEAHCVSQWGLDFRDSYRKLGQLRSFFPDVPIMALTATATPEVISDICKNLKLKNPAVTCTGFDRPNLYLSVSNKSGDIKYDLQSQMTQVNGRYQFTGPTIIYCPTKKATDDVTFVVKGMKVPCLSYHAGLSQKARKEAHKKFVNDEIQVVVATVAFGMGIDKPDCRKVIHYGAPKDIESYYQEIGRAGRDGLPSFCHTFYTKADFSTASFFFQHIQNVKYKQHKKCMLSKMQQYLRTSTCRRKILLSHFDKKSVEQVGGTENCCDNCRHLLEIGRHKSYYDNKTSGNWSSVSTQLASRMQPVDYRKEAKDFFNVVEGINGSYGLNNTVLVLTGSTSQKVKRFSNHKLFGIGKYKKINWWKCFGKCLIDEGYIDEIVLSGVNVFGSTIQTSNKARKWLDNGGNQGNKELKFVPNQELASEENSTVHVALRPNVPTVSVKSTPGQMLGKTTSTQISKVGMFGGPDLNANKYTPKKPVVDEKTAKLEADLYTKLIRQRNELSSETGYTPHSLASNKVLLDMAKIRPSTKDGLLKLEDFPIAKVEKFGSTFLKIIVDFCKNSDLKMDNFPETFVDKGTSDVPSEIYSLTETQRQSYIMFMIQNNSVEEVASRRGLKTSTIISHMAEAIKVGLSVDLELLGVTTHILKLVTKTIRGDVIKSDISTLTKIKDNLPDYIEFNHIKLVIAYLVRQYGQIVIETGQVILQNGDSQVLDSDDELNISNSQNEPETKCTQWSLQSGSQSQTSTSKSCTQSSGTKRKLPGWMSSSSGSKPLTKKMKSNSLFR